MNCLFDGLIDQAKGEKNTDYLTGTINRRGLHEIWNMLPAGAHVHCLYMDIDNFKLVNDVYGHAKGDELLLFVSGLLQEVFPGQLVVRLGGDEFVVICDAAVCVEEPEEQFALLQHRLRENFDESLREVLSFSIGFVAGCSVSENLSVILDQGDEAMYYVKKNGKGSYVNYEVIREQLAEQKAMKDRTLTSFREEEFELRFQPMIYLQNSDVYAAKAVLYWHFPGKGVLEEETFIPVLEQYGVITRLDKMMFEQICRWKQRWQDTVFKELQIYIRISARTTAWSISKHVWKPIRSGRRISRSASRRRVFSGGERRLSVRWKRCLRWDLRLPLKILDPPLPLRCCSRFRRTF